MMGMPDAARRSGGKFRREVLLSFIVVGADGDAPKACFREMGASQSLLSPPPPEEELSETSEWSAAESQKARRVSLETTFRDSASRAAARTCFRWRIVSTVAVMISATSATPIVVSSKSVFTCAESRR